MPRKKIDYTDDPMSEKKLRSYRSDGYHEFRLEYVAKKHKRSKTAMLTQLIDIEYQRVKKLEKFS